MLSGATKRIYSSVPIGSEGKSIIEARSSVKETSLNISILPSISISRSSGQLPSTYS